MAKAALMNREVEKGRALDDAESQQVIAVAHQAAPRFDRAVREGRPRGLADKEAAEIAILEAVPAAADRCRRARAAVDDAITETGASGPKDMGRVMKG